MFLFLFSSEKLHRKKSFLDLTQRFHSLSDSGFQGRAVVHQMMVLLHLEMQLRQQALLSFANASNPSSRLSRLDEVLALNEQLNEVGGILAGLLGEPLNRNRESVRGSGSRASVITQRTGQPPTVTDSAASGNVHVIQTRIFGGSNPRTNLSTDGSLETTNSNSTNAATSRPRGTQLSRPSQRREEQNVTDSMPSVDIPADSRPRGTQLSRPSQRREEQNVTDSMPSVDIPADSRPRGTQLSRPSQRREEQNVTDNMPSVDIPADSGHRTSQNADQSATVVAANSPLLNRRNSSHRPALPNDHDEQNVTFESVTPLVAQSPRSPRPRPDSTTRLPRLEQSSRTRPESGRNDVASSSGNNDNYSFSEEAPSRGRLPRGSNTHQNVLQSLSSVSSSLSDRPHNLGVSSRQSSRTITIDRTEENNEGGSDSFSVTPLQSEPANFQSAQTDTSSRPNQPIGLRSTFAPQRRFSRQSNNASLTENSPRRHVHRPKRTSFSSQGNNNQRLRVSGVTQFRSTAGNSHTRQPLLKRRSLSSSRTGGINNSNNESVRNSSRPNPSERLDRARRRSEIVRDLMNNN